MAHDLSSSIFESPLWLKGGHLQTLWSSVFRTAQIVSYQRERVELDDGDFLDLDWVGTELDPSTPIVIAIPGLEGNSNSHYAQALMHEVSRQGWRGVVINHRGCSGEYNRLPVQYHSGWTTDLKHVVHSLRQIYVDAPIMMVGYSLGGNQLLKWLGESADQVESYNINYAVAVSVPFDLEVATRKMKTGPSRFYQWQLLKPLKVRTAAKMRVMDYPLEVTAEQVLALKSFVEFDGAVTAPLHGFGSAQEYYQKSSCVYYLKDIRQPVTIVHAINDPLMTPQVVPDQSLLSSAISLDLQTCGGHVGFVKGKPWKPDYWLERRIVSLLSESI